MGSTARCWLGLTLLLASASMLTSCGGSMPVEVEEPPYPPTLTRACPPLAPLPDGSVASVAKALTDDAERYDECASRHRRLVEAIESRRTGKAGPAAGN